MNAAVRGALASVISATVAIGCQHAPPHIAPPVPTAVLIHNLQERIDATLADPALARGTWGIVVRSLDRDDTLYTLNDHRLLMPASSLKTVTLAVAADRLGWDYTYRTRLLAVGTVADGVLSGDLVVVGSGDPSIDDWDGHATRVFAGWADALRALGVQRVSGGVDGDDNAWEEPRAGAGWAWDDLVYSYATSVGALQFNENTARLMVRPGASVNASAAVSVVPDTAHAAVRGLVQTTPAGSGTAIQVRALPFTPDVGVSGSLAVDAAPYVRNIAVPNPTLYFAESLRAALVKDGIAIDKPAADLDEVTHLPDNDTSAVAIGEIVSAPLSSLATTMMKLSQNLYAETLLKTVGAGSTDNGIATVRAALAAWGIPADEWLMVDGSGLSRYNVITPAAMTAILTHVYRDSRLRDPFIATLPVAGVDGTLGGRMTGTPAAGNVRAKTGSFSNARAVAGFVRTADGEPLVFTIIANNYAVGPDVIDRATDAVLVELATFSRQSALR